MSPHPWFRSDDLVAIFYMLSSSYRVLKPRTTLVLHM